MHEECGCEEHHGHDECCCRMGHRGNGHFRRHFLTKAERIEKLENYVQELKNELTAVQERVKELKASK